MEFAKFNVTPFETAHRHVIRFQTCPGNLLIQPSQAPATK
jgi:hypothetical protein